MAAVTDARARRPRTRMLLAAAALLTAAVATAVAPAWAGPAGATPAARTGYPRNPASNLDRSQAYFGSGCQSRPTSVACERLVLRFLDTARARMHQPAYRVPPGFVTMLPADQILVLADGDRSLYGLPPLTGRNPAVTTAAQHGVARDGDPLPAKLPGVNAYASNWAGGMASGLFAYFEWMWDDGLGSNNIDCTRTHPSGCWGHRSDIIADFGDDQLPFGVGSGRSPQFGHGWTTLLEGTAPATALAYVPTVFRLSAHAGAVAGGARLTVRGAGLHGVRAVTLGGVRAPIVSRSPGVLVVRTPRHRVGAFHVQVVTGAGRSHPDATNAFRVHT